jgi:hypothetical protein
LILRRIEKAHDPGSEDATPYPNRDSNKNKNPEKVL